MLVDQLNTSSTSSAYLSRCSYSSFIQTSSVKNAVQLTDGKEASYLNRIPSSKMHSSNDTSVTVEITAINSFKVGRCVHIKILRR